MAEQTRIPRNRRKVLRVAACAFAALVVLGAGAAVYAYFRLNGNIKSVDIDARLGGARPPAATDGSFNILVLGSDSRSGENGDLAGGDTGGSARSDTAMVVHVSRDHSHADVVSIPRDTLVARPGCTDAGGRPVPGVKRAMYNSAFEVGGAACAVKTTEQLTGLRMDHYVQVDFAGFARVVDAMGGATVTTTVAIHDRDSGLDLPPGEHHLNGQQALAFVRTRHGVGDGSDLGRIELQKQMVKSLLRQAGGIGLFANPVELWSVGDTMTRSLTTDSALASVDALVGLAQELKGIGPDQLGMVTLPVVTAPGDPNRVVEQQPQADQVWAALKADRAIPQAIVATQPANPAQASPTAAPTAPATASAKR
ncbi:LytR family transcriptional regulator [Streptomyces kaniharaensis]|uniref:LytR family transcriptional regulator n=1 Tax=Streptomyces kaniharaensis TaxID=212423 RepID=A0A6N7KWR5_9ACTN|nr:LCP family protein [Streptomyces kaniharaensis]MQS14023.1 LytR family transcriptional regulator [Streptomyces kaniharaensis]